MAIKFLSSLDLGGSEIENFALETLTANPSSPTTGQIYFHTTDDQVKIYTGSAWEVVGLEYTAGNGITLTGVSFSADADDGISVGADGISVDSTVVRTSGAQTVAGNKTFSNNVVVTGNLTVNGTQTILNTAELAVEDSNITLNSGADAGADSGLSVDRGSGNFVPVFQWDESTERWSISNDGTTFSQLPFGASDNANNYSLPTASASTKGGVKIGSRITISSGVISADIQTANDFTNTLKTKLDGIATSADAYGSWTASDGTNSETIGSGAQVNFEGENATSVTYDATSNTFTISSDDTNTQYTVGDGGLTQKNFTSTLKTKLDGIATGADVTPSWVPATDPSYLTAETFGATDVVFTVDGNDVIAGDDLILAGGLSYNSGTKTLTSANDNTTYSIQDGELSQNNFTNADHTKLNGIEAGATADQTASQIRTALGTGNSGVVPSAGTAGHFLKHDGTFGLPSYTTNTNRSDASVYALFSGGSNITISASGVIAGTANTQLSDEQVQDIVGAMVSSNTETNITVTYNDTTGKLNFVATDTDTTYSAGNGLSLSGTTFSSDQSSYTESFSGVTSISVAQSSHRCAFPASITLFDANGNFVLADMAMDTDNGTVTVAGLPNGNYHISICGKRN